MQNRTKRRIGVPEILAPAGSMESLKAAVAAGCDAVYMGGSKFGARAYAQNPEEDEMVAAIRYCHLYGVKLYMTVNTLLKEQELQSLPTFLRPYYEAGLDAVIVQDMGVLRVIHQCFPDLDIHASTQMTLTSGMGVDDRLAAYGVTRIVPARELSLTELQQMRQQTKMELEVFVHGALCYCYSGQCLMSSMQGGRSGNRGRCAQPCRMQYDIDGSKRYLLSPKELCALPLLGEMIEAGIDSFKIEGRMKRPEYTAYVTAMYRKYRDLYLELGSAKYRVWQQEHAAEWEDDLRKLAEIYNREGFTDGYLEEKPEQMLADKRPKHGGVCVGTVQDVDKHQVRYRLERPIFAQDVLEFRGADGVSIYEYTTGSSYHAGELVQTRYQKGCRIAKGDRVFRTRHQVLLEEIRQDFVESTSKLTINGQIRIVAGEPILLQCEYENEIFAVTGMIAENAVKRAVAKEDVVRVLSQTGETPFEWGSLDVDLGADVFVPIGEFKKLRRNALTGLQDRLERLGSREVDEERIRQMQAEIKAGAQEDALISEPRDPKDVQQSAAVSDEKQLYAVLQHDCIQEVILREEWLDNAVIEVLLQRIKESKKRAVLALPTILRAQAITEYRALLKNVSPDGYLVRSQEGYQLLCDIGVKPERIRLDANMYIMNSEAAVWWREQGITQFTAPWELTKRELAAVTDGRDMQWICYGRIPLMVSAQCIFRNIKACLKNSGKAMVKVFAGEKGRRYIVRNCCKYCYNIIYREEPFQIPCSMEREFWEEVHQVRFEFTTETAEEVHAVLKDEIIRDHCRGHFDAGIQ